LPFKLNADRRHHIPKQKFKVTNSLGALLRSWHDYDANLRQRGGLTVWVTEEAVAARTAEPRTTRGGQPIYSPLAILTALTAWFKKCHFQVTPEINRALMVRGFLVLGVTLI